jgi:putative ubiquitin-RnfH superfamily antitoxin RatB of RatAB toxin-antitoxin module
MKVQVIYAAPSRLTALSVTVDDGATVQQAIEKSGILKKHPEIDLATQKVGIYSKPTPLDAVLEDGARIEIYRPIIADPKTVKRRAQPGKEAEA